MNEPFLKKKSIIKAQYIYNAVLLLVLLLGVSYAVVTFLYNEEGTSGSLTSSLVKITVDEETSFNLDNTSPVTDEVGLTGYSKTLTLTNTSSIDSLVNVTLNPDTGNNIPATSIKYGLYINGTLKKTASLTDTTIYNGLLLQGEKIQLEVYLWVDSIYTGTGSTFKGNFDVKSTEAVMTMADYVTKLVDKDKGVYKIGNDYRYSGTNPDNYIWFNCKDGTTSGANNCEKWQIVGSIETKANSYANTYRRVKIVKVDNLPNQTFGSNNTFTSSSLHTYLNGDYYTSLTTQAQKMVISSEWNVGSSALTNTPSASLTSEQASKLYTKVGLLSASDIGYSTNTDNQTKALNDATLYTNSWLKGSSYYTLTPINSGTTTVVGNNATSITSLTVTTTSGIKPTVSLMPNVYIKAGNGTENMPYEIALVDEEEHYSDVKVVGYITYDVNGQIVTAPKMQPIYADGSTVVNRTLSDTSEAKFKGWATSEDGEVVYQKGDAINIEGDVTLYAKWELISYLARFSDDAFWPENIVNQKNNIASINFVTMGENEMATRYNSATIKADVTDTTKSEVGSVLAWLETDTTDETKYIMYVASGGITYFPSNVSSMFGSFRSNEINLNNINTSEVVNMSGMFGGCSSLTSMDVSNFDVSSVTNVASMFAGCSGLRNLNMSNWDGTILTYLSVFSSLFPGCSNLELDLSNWKNINKAVLNSLFSSCSSLTSLDLSGWDTSSVIQMSGLFAGSSNLTSLDLSGWNTSSVVNMSQMFYNCQKLVTLDISDWDTSNVTNMYGMFQNCLSLTNLDVSGWDTVQVTNMQQMFNSCSSLTNLDLSSWDTVQVTNMQQMFNSCSSLTSLDISNWNVGNVTNFNGMIASCSSLRKLDMSNWDFNQKTSLPGFSSLSIISGCSDLELDASNWKIPNITNVSVFSSCTALVKVDVSGWDTSKVTTTAGMFSSCSNLISVDFTGWDTSKVTNMPAMFSGCSKLISLDLSGWDMSSLTNTNGMFMNCNELTTIYSDLDWNTEKVTSSQSMFQGCTSLVGAVPFDSSKIDITMANPTTGYFTVKPTETTE